MKEREADKERKKPQFIYWKTLRLITPELAQKLGLPAESPVFISPREDGKDSFCPDCLVQYGPLVYQPGTTVTAHHFHPRNEYGTGGIYLFRNGPFAFKRTVKERARNPWIALLQPLGKVSKYHNAEAAEVLRILAVYDGLELEEGFLFDNGHGLLYPFPAINLEKLPKITAQAPSFRFEITEEGEVLFSSKFDLR